MNSLLQSLLAQSNPGTIYDKPIGPPAKKEVDIFGGLNKPRNRQEEELGAILKGDFNKAKQIRDNDRAKKRAARGDVKTVAQKKTETPGTWNNSVAQARKRLGIKQGEDLDSLLKSALWVYRYSDADETTSKDEVDDVVRMMQSPEGRAELKSQIERFRNPEKPEHQVKAGNLSESELNTKRRQFQFEDAMDSSGLGHTFRSIENVEEKIQSNAFIDQLSKVAGFAAKNSVPGLALGAAGVDVAGVTEDVTKGAISGTLTTPARIPANLMKLVSGGMPIEQRGYALAELLADSLDIGGVTGAALKANKAGIKSIVKALAEEAVKKGDIAEEVIEQAVKAIDDIPEEQIDEITYKFRQPENVGGDVGAEFRKAETEIPVSRTVEPENVSLQGINQADDLPPVADTAADVPKATQMEHAATANERALRDVSQYVKTSKPLDELVQEASGVNAQAVVNEINTKARPMSDAEQAAVTQLYHQNKTQRNELIQQFEGADFDTQARLQSQIDLLDKEATDILEASDKAGSEWGRSGRARQLEIEASADPAAIKYRYYKATGEKQLPESLAKDVEELQKLRADLDAANAKIADVEKQLAEQGIQGVKKAREGKKPIQYVRKVNKTDFEKALAIWEKPAKPLPGGKRGGVVRMPDPERWRAAKTIVRYHFDNGVENVVDLANKLIEATGMDEVLAYRAIREAVTDEGRIVNAGRAEGEEILIRGSNAYESKEVRDMRFQADRKKAEIDKAIRKAEKDAEFANKSWGKKALSITGDALGTTRTMLSMGDLSAPFRQGLILSIVKPKSAGKAWGNMIKSFTEAGHERAMWELTQHPRYNEAVSGKLAIADDVAGRTNKEEEFIANLFERVKNSGLGKVLNAVPSWSERTYTAFLNTLRMDAFATYVDALEGSGVKLSKSDLEDLAEWVNIATGRGSLGRFEESGNELAKWLYSPRLLASRFQLVTAKPLRDMVKKADPKLVERMKAMGLSDDAAQKMATDRRAINSIIAKDYVGAMTTIGLTLGLAGLSGMTELDPRSSRFGKIRAPGTDVLIDVTGGMSGVASFLSRLGFFASSYANEDIATRKTWKGNYADRGDPWSEPLGQIGRFALGKSAPPVRALFYGLNKKDFKGDETSLEQQAAKSFVPIGAQQAYENVKEGVPPHEVVLASLLEFFGFGTSSDPGGRRVEVPDE